MAKDNLTVILIIAAVIIASQAGVVDLGGLFSASGADAAEADQTGVLCLNDGSVMTVGPSEKRYAPTTSVTGEYHRVVVDGINRGLKIDGTTMDVTTPTRVGGTDGSDVAIFYAENSSTYYAAKQAFSVPCVSAFSTAARPDSDAYQLVTMATTSQVAVTVFNDDDGLKNTAANNETMAANDASNMDMKVKFSGKYGYSPYGAILATVVYNSSIYDEVSLTSVDTTVSEGVTPDFRESESSASGYKLETFSFPGVEGLSVSEVNMNVYVETGSQGPTGTAASNDIAIYFDDEDYFLNTETGDMELGSEDNDDTDVGYGTDVSVTISIDA